MNEIDEKNNLNNEETAIIDEINETDNSEELNEKENLENQEQIEDFLSNENDKEENNEDVPIEENLEENNEDVPIEENLKDEILQLKDEKLRLLAEMENLRKRSNKERVDSIRYGSMNLARDILSPDDNLTRALNALPQDENNTQTIVNLIEGLKMVQKEFSTILEKHGIKKIIALNARFDHNFHQAMVEIENNDVEEGVVIQEMQSGYTMHDRLLRPSMVGVAKKKPKNNENEKQDKKNQQ